MRNDVKKKKHPRHTQLFAANISIHIRYLFFRNFKAPKNSNDQPVDWVNSFLAPETSMLSTSSIHNNVSNCESTEHSLLIMNTV